MDAMMQALLGGDELTDDEKLRKTANALRGAKNAADFFGLSTIKPVARQANVRNQDIMDAAKRGGILREGALRRKQQEADTAQHQENLLQQRGWQEQDTADEHEFQLKLQKQKADEKAALEKAKRAEQEKDWLRRMPAGEKKKFRQSLNGLKEAEVASRMLAANPGAFAQGANLAGYYGEGVPKVFSKLTREQQAKLRSDPELRTRYRIMSQAYKTVKELAGTQQSAKELGWIDEFVPGPTDTQQQVESKLNALRSMIASGIDTMGTTYGVDVTHFMDDFYTAYPDASRKTISEPIAGSGTDQGLPAPGQAAPEGAPPDTPPAQTELTDWQRAAGFESLKDLESFKPEELEKIRKQTVGGR